MANDLTFNILAGTRDATTNVDKLAESIDKLAIKIDVLDHAKADPKVEVKTDEANAKLDDLNKRIEALKVSQVGAGILGSLIGAGAIVGAGLLTIPAAVIAIGAAAEKTDPQVTAAFSNMANQAKQTAQVGFAPLAPALANFGNEATTALGQVRGQLAQSAEAAAPMVDIIGRDFIQAAQEGIGASGPILKGMQQDAQALGDDLVKVERGAVGFFAALDPGPAAQGLSELGTQVGDLLPKIGALVNDIVPLGNDFLNVVGPALNDTAQDAHLLAVPLQAVGSAIGFIGPVVGASVPVVLALAGASKLLTGSWTDWSTAAQKAISPVTNFDGVVTSLGNKIGLTTAKQNEDNKKTLDAALVRATLAKQTAEATALETAWAAAEAGTAEAELAAVAAADELAAADEVLTKAEVSAAAAAEGMTFSLGPIGAVLGLAAGAAAIFGLQSKNSGADVRDLSQQIIQLGNDAPGAAASLVAGSADLQHISGDLKTVGTSATAFASAYSGSLQSAQQYTDNLTKSQHDLGDKVVQVTEAIATHDAQGNQSGSINEIVSKSIKDVAASVAGNKDAYNALDPALRRQVDLYNAYNNVLPQANSALNNMKAAQEAEQASLAQEGIVLGQATQAWDNYGTAITKRATDFNAATAGIKSVTDNLLTADSTFFQAQANFQQLDQAVVQAGQAEQQSVQGVANAAHSLQQAVQGVAQARLGEQQAIFGVQTAEQQVVKSQLAEQQAIRTVTADQKALTQARVDATQQLSALQRQEADQGDTLAEAQIRLLDAQDAVKAAGLNGKSLADFGGVTTQNEVQYKLLLTLQEAQHNLNEVTAQGQVLAGQNAAAQAAGVDGSQQVVSAQQQLASAQQAVIDGQQQIRQSAQALQQANQGVTQASQAVANAQWSEQQASQAVGQANQAEHNSKVALQQAKDADSRSTDLNSAAGVRNYQMIEQLFEDNKAVTPNIDQATAATEQQAVQFGINKQAVDAVITSLTKIPVTTPFAIVGTPSLNLTALIQQAQAVGVSPFSLGLDQHEVSLAIENMHGKADGGLISGPGTGTSDSILARTDGGGMLRVSNGEYVVNAIDTAKNIGLLEQINSGQFPGFASGGQVDGKSLLAVNFRLAGWEGFLQGVSHGLQAFGINTPNLPAPTAIDFGPFGAQAAGSLAASGASASQAQAYALSIFPRFGWGPDQMPPLIKLWNQESGWNPYAVNPVSGAAGIAQSLGHGPVVLGDYKGQVDWGEGYIHDRYGSPQAAWAHEVADHWYRRGGVVAVAPPKALDSGGYVDPGLHLYYNGTGQPERTRTAAQEDALLRAIQDLRGDIKNLAQVTVHPPAGASADAIVNEVLRRLQFHGR